VAGSDLAGFKLASFELASFELASFELAGFELAGFELAGSALSAGAIGQPAVGGGGKGAKGPAPLTPGRWFMPTAGKAPGSGALSTGREPHAIHGVTLPVAVILTVPRLLSPHHPARQTASSLGDVFNRRSC